MPQAPSPPALDLRNVSVAFGGVRALDDVDFSVGAGEIHCLAGENGCGKSTLIKVIAGVHRPRPGASLRYFGEARERVTPDLARALGVAVIWQDLALFPQMSVAENIAFDHLAGPRPSWVDRAKLRAAAGAALQRLGVEIDLDARLGALPIAKRQLTAIARALASDARILFMDEPTASLTQAETDHLLAVVRTLAAAGVAIVFVSHRLAETLDVAGRVTVLRDGRLVGVFAAKGMTPARLGELMTGRRFDLSVAARETSALPPALAVRGLSRAGEYEDVDLDVRAGEIVGLIGLIGAGRTELAHSLFGMTKPGRGAIRIAGGEVRFASNRDAIAAGIAYVSEDRLTLGLVQPQSIADNIVVTGLKRISGAFGLISGAKKAARVQTWVADLAIKVDSPGAAVSTLSGGNQQRVALAKWLATGPKVLILDCPTVGVDVGARDGIYAIIRALAARGIAILLISDEAPEVYFNADRVLHMAGGRVAGAFDPRVATLAQLEGAIYA